MSNDHGTRNPGTRNPATPAEPGSLAEQLAAYGLRARTSSANKAPAATAPAAEPAAPAEPQRPTGNIDQGWTGGNVDTSFRTADPAKVNAEIARIRNAANREK